VLVRCAQNKGHRLKFQWTGPRRVITVKSDLVFEVENLADGKRETVHARRLQLYRADLDGEEVDPNLQRAAEDTEAVYQGARELRAIREKGNQIQIPVEWDGLPDKVDMTWEPVNQVNEDLPQLLRDFLQTPGMRDLKDKALSMCSLN